MSKVKSAILLALMSALIAVLVIVCFIPIQYGENMMYRYDPIIVWADRDPDLGTTYGAAQDEYSKRTNYIGGAYTAVYYPEGVISAKEYRDNVNGISDQAEKTKYEEKYTCLPDGNGAIYLEEGTALEDGKVSESFVSSFNSAAELIRSRYERLHEEVRVEIADDYTVRVTAPRGVSAAFTPFSYTGEFTVLYGSDEASAETILPRRPSESINDYVKGASMRTAANGSPYVVISFTKAGREIVASKTAGASESSATMFFKVGDNIALQLSVTTQIDESSLAISGSNFTSTTASISAIVIDSALNGEKSDLSFVVGDIMSSPALYGTSSMTMLYIAFGVLFVAAFVFFAVRYHLLAFVNLYTYLLYLCVNLLCLWAIPFVTLSVETVLAFLLGSLVLLASNAAVYESARKDFATGKTIASSVKGAYKKNFWHIFDGHIVLALAGFVTFFIALGAVRQFAFVFALATVFSGLFTLAINRLNWAIMMAYTGKPGAFCNFKKTEADDE